MRRSTLAIVLLALATVTAPFGLLAAGAVDDPGSPSDPTIRAHTAPTIQAHTARDARTVDDPTSQNEPLTLAGASLADHVPPSDQVDTQQRNLALARAIEAVHRDGPGGFQAAIATLDALISPQPTELDRASPTLDPATSTLDPAPAPSAAAEQLAAALDRTLTTDEQATLAALDGLGTPTRTALADVLGTTTRLVVASQTLPGQLDEPRGAAVAEVLELRAGMLEAFDRFERTLPGSNDGLDDLPVVRLAPVLAIDLAGEDTVYEEDYVLQIDVGGNDTYLNNAGGSGVDLDACPEAIATFPLSFPHVPSPSDGSRAAALLDLAGDDTYGDRATPRHCGVNGGGYRGAGLLVDAAGDDTYIAGGHATNGGSLSGMGLLVDLAGADTYTAGTAGVNGGAAEAGVAALVDLSGDDAYTAANAAANGGAITGGQGYLVDASGDDVYDALSVGTNGGASTEGLGHLIDLDGQDAYTARTHGTNGGGYSEGLGFLYDATGSEIYRGSMQGTNGGGAQGGFGLLVDGRGEDVYTGAPPAFTRSSRAPAGSGAAALSTETLADASTTDRFILGLDADPLPAPGTELLGATVLETLDPLGHVAVQTSEHQTLLTRAVEDPRVRFIEPDHALRADLVPNDPRWGEQYGPAQINAPDAWDTTTGSTDTLACVVDTGVRATHQDLAGRVLGGYDVVNDDPDPTDDHGHGTHVAGILAAGIDDGLGIAGTAEVSIWAIKALDEEGSGPTSGVAEAVVRCTDAGADVINLSLGGGAGSRALHEAVRYAHERDAVLVAAAGNVACHGCLHYPAAYPEVINVGCTDPDRNICAFSNQGTELELAAPGQAILSSVDEADDTYGTISGTSMSAPHVAGVAALVRDAAPELTNAQARRVLQATAQPQGPTGCDTGSGYGIVDAAASLGAALAGEIPQPHDLPLCANAHAGANGGGYWAGTGVLIDADGSDTYAANDRGVNGGGAGGYGLLVDAEGDDRYLSGEHATNGGADAGVIRRTLWAHSHIETDYGTGLLLDSNGTDVYHEAEAGTTVDTTTAPKGTAGAQVDSDDPPDASGPDPGPDPENTSVPRVVQGRELVTHERIVLNRSLIVPPGGHLILSDVTLLVDEGGQIDVLHGGNLTVLDSEIATYPGAPPDWGFTLTGGDLYMEGSHLHGHDRVYAGWAGGPLTLVHVRDSLIEDARWAGFALDQRAVGTFLNNTFVNNGHDPTTQFAGAIAVRTATLDAHGNTFIGNHGMNIGLVSTFVNARVFGPVTATLTGNVIAYNSGAGIHFQEYYRTMHRVESNLFTCNGAALNLAEAHDQGLAPDPVVEPIFVGNTIVDNHIAGRNQGFRLLGTGALNSLHDYALPLVDSWLGPDGPTFDEEERNRLEGPWDTSELASEDPNPARWAELAQAEERTGIASGPWCG